MTSDAEYCMSERSIESVFDVCLLLSNKGKFLLIPGMLLFFT